MTIQDEGRNRAPCPYFKEPISEGAQICPLCESSLVEVAPGAAVGQPLAPGKVGQAMSKKSIALTIALVIAVIIVGNALLYLMGSLGCYLRGPAVGRRTACQRNLKNIATALGKYAADNQGNYPFSLDGLTPDYMRTIPTCPAAGTNTYVYEPDSFLSLASGHISYDVRIPHAFTVYCAGINHRGAGLGENQPSYTSREGLMP